MNAVHPINRFRIFYRRDIEIDDHRILPAAQQHAFQRLVFIGIDFLVRHIRRHVDEIAGAGLRHELQPLAPTHARTALHDINHALHRAMMMRTGLGVRMDGHRTGPDFLGPHAREIDRGGAGHVRRLRGIAVEGIGRDDAYAVFAPADGVVFIVHYIPTASFD